MKTIINTDNTAIIIPDNRIDISNSHELKEALVGLYNKGLNLITIDFINVNRIDSSGLGKILLFQKKLKERGGELTIINVTSEYVKQMFAMIHLNKVIKVK
ncbi:MAG: STAS domain-containing protein [Bacillota bacterium]|nr:STAS domain-containing protein [Bacillota bacterium]